MTHALFIAPYYPPEKAAAAVRISETAVQLVRRGYEVTVLTTMPNYPTGIVPPEYLGRIIQQENYQGVRVVRVWSYASPNRGFFRRVLAQFSFGCFTTLLGWKAVGRPDIIIAQSAPLINSIAVLLLSWGKHCPFILSVADLWPEVAVKMGMLRNRTLIWLAEQLALATYKRAALIWALTQGLGNILVQRSLSPEKVFVLTNGVDCSKFRPQSQREARLTLGWDDRFTILYAGGLGPSHSLATVLDTAEIISEHKDIHIILVGDGAEKDKLVSDAQRRGLKNITFLDSQPHDCLPLFLAASDACLATASKEILFQGVIPMKMYEAMACARPVILMVDGEARQIAVQNARAAIYAEPENPSALASAILHLHAHPEEAELLGQRGRTFVEKHFDRSQLVAKLDLHIQDLLEQKHTTSKSSNHNQTATNADRAMLSAQHAEKGSPMRTVVERRRA